jgi:hypothetical protein
LQCINVIGINYHIAVNGIDSQIGVLVGKTKMWHKRNNNEHKFIEVKKGGGKEVIFLDEKKGERGIKND